MAKTLRAAVVGVGLVVLVGGCTKEPSGPTMLEARPQRWVADLPVPKDFEQNLGKSTDTSKPGRRRVDHVYEGKAHPTAVRNFYKDRMLNDGWELLQEQLQNSIINLNYKKNSERCEVRIERMPAGFLRQITQIRATIRSEDDTSD